MDRFGPLALTYCFAGLDLTRRIPARIAPKLDQHAGYELRPDGRAICDRLGQAADCRVPDVASDVVANYIVAELPFDRLYYYGPDRPLHVSYGPQHSRAAWRMVTGKGGRLLPRRW